MCLYLYIEEDSKLPSSQNEATRLKTGGYSYHVDRKTSAENVSSCRDHVTIFDARTMLCFILIFVNHLTFNR